MKLNSDKKSKLQQAQDKTQAAVNQTNKAIERLGCHTGNLYESLERIQDLFDNISNFPREKKLEYEDLKKIRYNWKDQAKKIEKDYNEAAIKNIGAGAAGAGLGLAVVTMGPTAAMGIATTFGLASTGTAISALSGAAATNAALAWLGGGALVAGGGGMAAGQAFIALAGPVGWAIAGITLVSSTLLFWKSSSDKKTLENVFIAISHRDIKSYELAIIEIKERITHIIDETYKLNEAIENIKTFGLDYNMMTEKQQYVLGSYYNFMLSSTQLLINPVKGLQAKLSKEDFKAFISWKDRKANKSICQKYKNLIISLANLLYKINLDKKSKKLLWKYLRKDEKFLESMNISKKEFEFELMNIVFEALDFKYNNEG